ncbi:hypothetical protein [Sphingobacterium bovistauri]|uniref:Uncharacterized protein n=1 Tax=Sphingobacterium bovistauri TaxID=2781959 RepID=A0ABS7Z3F0_9SPHI|nr:hypothetical protein [Sphingobacterium bovistauri]MCA5004112.1 hypothetical protein [Sphingobacterium bovistauri]
MIKLNVVSRIADDKDFFNFYLEALSLVKKKFGHCIGIYFIGEIYCTEVFNKIVTRANELSIRDLVSFSNKSIPINELPSSYNDVYLNISIGDFIGYSSIECLYYGLKTIFYNGDSLVSSNSKYRCFCNTIEELAFLLNDIQSSSMVMQNLIEENRQLLQYYFISDTDKKELLKLLI